MIRIEPGETWADLGANVGAFTCLAASLGAKVYAFEPHPENFQLLEQNVKLNAAARGCNPLSASCCINLRGRAICF